MGHYDISVIIPVYNAVAYIGECIESVLAQTFQNIQIIIVDDGSTDGTTEIVKDYQRKHESIMVIYQENSGVEKARVEGYRNATGEYIGWIDADDLAKPEMFEKLYRLAVDNHADYVYCDYEFFPTAVSTKSKWFKEYKGVRDGDFIDRNTQCWNTLVKRSLYEKVHIDELLIEYSEYSWIAAMLQAENIAFTNESLYKYRVGHTSASGGNFVGKVPYYKRVVENSKKLKNIICGTEYEKELDSYFDYRYIYSLLLLLLVSSKNDDKETYEKTRTELNRMKFRDNPYLDRFIANNYGKLKAWVITRVVPSCYLIARPLVKSTL